MTKRFIPKEWLPIPFGIICIVFLGPSSILWLFLSVASNDVFFGLSSLVSGAFCIYFTADATYHVGMRKQAAIEQLRETVDE